MQAGDAAPTKSPEESTLELLSEEAPSKAFLTSPMVRVIEWLMHIAASHPSLRLLQLDMHEWNTAGKTSPGHVYGSLRYPLQSGEHQIHFDTDVLCNFECIVTWNRVYLTTKKDLAKAFMHCPPLTYATAEQKHCIAVIRDFLAEEVIAI